MLAHQAATPQLQDMPQQVEGQNEAAAAEALVMAIEFPNADEEQDPARDAPNPLLPLLTATTQLRATALLVLSDALGIPLVKEGVHR